MQYGTERKIGEIRDFKGLVRYLRDELDWPLDLDEIEDLTFEYEAEELGLKADLAVKVKEVKQIRPVVDHQPWGIFWVEFENRALPVTVMRQILRALVYKKRATAKAADRKAWHLRDLIFMSSLGEKGSRRINLSHFRETGEGEPTLQTFFWDEQETQFYWLDQNHLEHLRWPRNTDDIDGWRRQWASAFTAGYREPVRTAKDLSERLAALAACTRDAVLDVLRYETSAGPLHRLLESFQTVLLHDLDEGGFADMVAQTIAYGLFSARCTGQEVLGLAHLEAMVPNTNRFLKELFAELARISGHRKGQINFDDLGLSEMVTLLRDKNIEAVLEEFGRQAGGGKEDPVVHFYETFLNVYDKQQKVQRGVFYTPKPVVSFIVRSVHEVLQQEFGLADGLADTTTWGEMADRIAGLVIPKQAKANDPFVQVLDPATGTGTFLEEVVEVVHETMIAKWKKQGKSIAALREAWNEYVPKHLLPRLRGFELMMAPYAVAHMKIGLKLRQTGYDFKSNERLRVYLTNALEPPEKGTRKLGFLPDFLSHESMQADAVKDHKAITVVLGNPPWAVTSLNSNHFIDSLLGRYKAAVRGEQGLVALSDDYIKFLCFAESLLMRVPARVLGIVTNRGYLKGIIHRGLRQSLIGNFEHLWVADLHGDSNIGEAPPPGQGNGNVFDIQQGVSIGIFAHKPGTAVRVLHSDLWGAREEKYSSLLRSSIYLGDFTELTPTAPHYFFVPFDSSNRAEYEALFSIAEAMPVNSCGVKTHRDAVVIDFDRDVLRARIEDIATETDLSVLRDRYSISDTPHWRLSEAKKLVKGSEVKERIHRLTYRPFDQRWIYYNPDIIEKGDSKFPTLRHLLSDNVAILTSRIQAAAEFNAVFVSRDLVEMKTAESTRSSTVFPLYVYGDRHQTNIRSASHRRPNFSDAFTLEAERTLGRRIREVGETNGEDSITPEQVLGYIYAVLWSGSYRARYREFLLVDFPRIPLTSDPRLFGALSALGMELVRAHVAPGVQGIVGPGLNGTGDRTVAPGHPRYIDRKVYISPIAWFEPVEPEVWEFEVGGYQVCQKWLKDRRGRRLQKSDVERYGAIVASIRQTRSLERKIEVAIDRSGGWPLRGSTQR